MSLVNRNSPPRFLLLSLASPDSNRKGLPFIRAAQSLGCEVISVTHDKNSELLCGDINEVVRLGELSRVRDLLRKHRVDFAMTVNSRLTPLLAHEIEASGCPLIPIYSENAAATMAYKDRCARFLNSVGLNAVEHWIPTQASDWSEIPDDIALILKPTFSTGAIDTLAFPDRATLQAALGVGLRSETLGALVHLEQFHKINADGCMFDRWMIQRKIHYKRQIGLEIVVANGVTTVVHAGEILTDPDHGIAAYAHVGPIPMNDDIGIDIISGIKRFISSLGLTNCNMTPDILVDHENKWYLIDANLNVGGEGLLDVVRARGVDYPLESLKAFFGQPHSFETTSIFAASFSKTVFSGSVGPMIATDRSMETLLKQIEDSRFDEVH